MSILPFSRPCYLAALLIAAGGAGMPARADISLPTVPPPQPQASSANVYIGESVEIPLSGVSRSGAGMQFLIRRQPAAGKLSEIRMTGPNTAVVTYTHLAVGGAGIDHFRYAASAVGAGVSTPAEVTINISERPAVFHAPARLDFPDTAVGQTSRQTLELRNDGGGLVEGRLVVPAPWKILDGDGSYSLGAGSAMSMTITFTPTMARSYSATGQFSHSEGLELGLGGSSYNPIEIVPREIRLETDGRNEVRTGSFLLRNVSLGDHELRITAPPEVVVQDSIKSAPNTETQVAIHTRAGFLGGLDEKIKITGDGISIEVPLHVMPSPPRLTVKPFAVDFGTLDAGRAGHGKITVRNAGGSAADLTARIPEGVEISPYPGGKNLQPGASMEFDVRLSRPLAGKFSDFISLESSESLVRIPLSAVIQQSDSPAAESHTPKPEASSRAEVVSDIPPVMEVAVTRQTQTELDLAWAKTSPKVVKYIVVMRSIIFDSSRTPHFKYEPLTRLKVRFVRDQARTTLAGLRAGESVTLCILGVDSEGLVSRSSPAFTLATKPKPVFHFPWFWTAILVLAVLLALIVRERMSKDAAGGV